jgi:hypothetical protein
LLADCQGKRLFVADAHRGDAQRFIVHADEKLTAFVELGSAIRGRQSTKRIIAPGQRFAASHG